MADVFLVLPGSVPETEMSLDSKDQLWIIFTAPFCWDPTDDDDGFGGLLLKKGVYGVAGEVVAKGPIRAANESTVSFPDPSPPADCAKKKRGENKPGPPLLTNPHSITIS
jgi:hypothetical protein